MITTLKNLSRKVFANISKRWHGSLNYRIAFSLISAILLSSIVYGLVSGFTIFYFVHERETATLRSRLDLVSLKMEDTLNKVTSDIANLAKNTLVMNAIVDTYGRESYLVPFFKDHIVIDEVPHRLILCDFQGAVIASNTDMAGYFNDKAMLDELIEKNRPVAKVVDKGKREGNVLQICYPVTYFATGMSEGFLVFEAKINDLIQSTGIMTVGKESSLILMQNGVAVWASGSTAGVSMGQQLKLRGALSHLNLMLEVRNPRSFELLWLAAFMIFATAVMVLVSIRIAYFISDYLTKRLVTLSEAASNIALSGAPDSKVDVMGDDEIGYLAESFNRMVERLHESYEVLERRVEERTYLLAGTNRQLLLEIEQRKDAELRAEASSKAKSEFLANISHEIRTPMNAILGFCHLALLTGLTSKQREFLTHINVSAETLLGVINDLLDFSKIESGKMELENVPFELNDLLDNLTSITNILIGDKNLELVCSASSEIPPVLTGDPMRLTQVLTNLLNNAVKFTNQGKISLLVDILPDEISDEGVTLCFSVKDTGIGITEEQQERLFQPFSQGDSSTVREYGGTGLGLSICKRLVEMAGGSIRVESIKGSGSNFIFTMRFGRADSSKPCPVVDYRLQQHETFEAVEREYKSSLSGMRVLVAEDNEVNRIFIREILRKVGIEAVMVDNGKGAVQAVKEAEQPFDLVLMDIQMPVMDGYEATRLIRAESGTEDIPIVAMTAHALAEEKQRSLSAGMNMHLCKPINVKELYSALMLSDKPVGIEPEQDSCRIDPEEGSSSLHRFLPGINVKKGLDSCDGDMQLMKMLITSFASDKREVVSKIREALEQGDWEQAGFIVHGLKGVSGVIAADALHNTVIVLEEALIARNQSQISQHLRVLEDELQLVLESAGLLARI